MPILYIIKIIINFNKIWRSVHMTVQSYAPLDIFVTS